MEIRKNKYLNWSYKIIFILMGLLVLKVSEFNVLYRIIHWAWKIPVVGTEELIGTISTTLIFMPFLFIVMKQRIRLEGAEEKFKALSYYDQLTGLSNRRYFEENLTHSLIDLGKENKTGVVLFLDFDGFKQVNDNHGHEVGDLLLKEMGNRLLDCIRKEDTISRYAGDEFVIFLPDTDKPAVINIVKRILEEMNKPITINKIQIKTSTSIGLAFFPEHGTETITLIRNADVAMYKAKSLKKNSYYLYDQGAHEAKAKSC
ncbi:GGDEF domain-containing protein [Bacillus salipaludis]|uniref:GGDEF domain-containing protein n=1 Tax=Bacillus salipaludis TaxID=2547811 RepID=A0A4R5W016_9BACI|nr:GGDEF domain-containing protein [Bacillus salipaludis]TDK64198.1 GGDEF domain-containing protein [Bacillus salipaludis]